MYIADQESLAAFIGRAQNSSVLAVDTEFLREKTYYPQLCLLQLATETEVAIVDPLSIDDLSALVPLFEDEKIVKLFHAASQDIEIIWHETGVMPHPLFDTQLAAALLGHTQQIGYAALVHAECGVQLKKIDSFTDWSRRPLTHSQITYAADDVIYLPQIYAQMKRRLEEKGRLAWLDPDFENLIDPRHYEEDPYMRFRRLKRSSSLTRPQLACAREFAAWREITARKRNLPRKWVVTDEQIVEACRRDSRTIDDLYMIRGMRERLSVADAREVLLRMRKALAKPYSTYPEFDKPPKSEPNVDAALDLMGALVRLRAKENDVAMQTLASHDDLVAIARGYTEGVDLLRGWRRALVGEELLDLLNGRITLSLSRGELVVEHVQ